MQILITISLTCHLLKVVVEDSVMVVGAQLVMTKNLRTAKSCVRPLFAHVHERLSIASNASRMAVQIVGLQLLVLQLAQDPLPVVNLL